jgi:subtilisin family serine protease
MKYSEFRQRRAKWIFNLTFVLILPFSGFLYGKMGASSIPEEQDPTLIVSTDAAPSFTPSPGETQTPTATEASTLQENTENPGATFTPTIEPSGTMENTATPTLAAFTATATSTVTTTIKPADTSCDKAGVFHSQITISSTEPGTPKVSGKISVVDQFEGVDGNYIQVVQADPIQYCRILNELQNDDDVLLAEPNYQVSLLDVIPNDSDFGQQYYLSTIRAPQAWEYTTGIPAVIIAVLDTGIDLNHNDLAGRVIAGFDFVQNDAVPQDENGHGTHVAGIAAANGNNGIGIAGVDWQSQIMPVRVLDAYGNGSFANVAQGIIWATDHGARVINLSLGGSQYSSILEDSVAYAVEKGVILVAATGNSGLPTVLYPAAFPGVVGVGATDQSNHLAWFSNTGEGVDVVAPGVSIYGLDTGNGYRFRNGTSMAAPQVAGFAALLAGLPGMQYSSSVIEKIESSAKDLGSGGWDPEFGYGLIQVGPAIKSVAEHLSSPKPPRPENTPTPYPPLFPLAGGRDQTRTPTEMSFSPTAVFEISVTPAEIAMQLSDQSRSSPPVDNEASNQSISQVKNNRVSRNSILFPIGLGLIILGLVLFWLLWWSRRSDRTK